ncbi:MAG: patatin-like phospholipase family protein, partial [Candidatus Gastranaerophilales bacterium]|nr:patatin-like phospholipase family protein [Candidatus Gastranaerophilales bacterium]
TYTCIFGGGAVRGIAYVGAIKALKELGIAIDTFAGSSVGSIAAALFAIGYSADEIKELFMQVNFELFKDIHFNINKDFALSKGNIFTNWIREAIEKKFYGNDYKKGENKPVTFNDINTNLIILTTDLNKFKPYEFSTFETPDYEIASAIRISCSMPGLMTPVEIENKKLVDGDILKGIPLWKLSKNLNLNKNRVLEFRLEGEHFSAQGNTFEFLNSIYSCMTSTSTDFIMDLFGINDKFDYIKITTGDIIVIDFNISQKTRNKLIDTGYNDSIKYLTKDCIKKKISIAEYYTKINQFLEELSKALRLNNVLDSKEILKDMFLYISDIYKYIDTDIFENIRTLKNDIMTAPLKKGWFKNLKFRNKQKYIDVTQLIIKVVTIKKQELENYAKELF